MNPRTGAVAVLTALALVSLAPAASGSTASEERQGAALAKAVNGGQRSCGSLTPADFGEIGEYAMGLNFTSTQQHEAMNGRMTEMMGADGERQAHRAMGRAYSGCAGGGDEGGAAGGGMMGSYGGGMMGGTAYGPAMMGGRYGVDDGLGTSSVVLVGVLSALLGGGLVALLLRRRLPGVR